MYDHVYSVTLYTCITVSISVNFVYVDRQTIIIFDDGGGVASHRQRRGRENSGTHPLIPATRPSLLPITDQPTNTSMAPHVKSKRQTTRHKVKVAKKLRQHHRDVRRANRKKPEVRKIKRKDPGIPNLAPFKQQMLETLERKKNEQAELKKTLSLARRAAFREAREQGMDPELANVVADAKMRQEKFDQQSNAQGAADEANAQHIDAEEEEDEQFNENSENDTSRKAFMKDFKKVVESSDVLLEVLDARDPLGCRCYEAEKQIMSISGGTKRIVLVLNKVDLIPKEVTNKWLAYLRNDFPTIAFRSSIQESRNKSQANLSALTASSLNTNECLGANNLLSLLKNYSRNHKLKTLISVGIIGYPNVGKSSLINSLKRSRVVHTGNVPGITRNVQHVQLDKNLNLIDCPGIVFSSVNQKNSLVLRNCIKIENLLDPISPIDMILQRVGHQPLMIAYGIPEFKDINELLACICTTRGKMKVGGVFDVDAAARLVLRDWNCGNIPFYTLPPKGPSEAHIGASVVQNWGKEFDVNSIMDSERQMVDSANNLTSKDIAKFAQA